MNSNLQKYFDLITESEYKGTLEKNLEKTYKNLLLDIEKLLNIDIKYKLINSFSHLEITKIEGEIDCILSVYKVSNASLYISLAKQIARFFNDEFPYSEKDLNIGLPTRSELRASYKYENTEGKLLYTSGIHLSNELTEIRITIYKI